MYDDLVAVFYGLYTFCPGGGLKRINLRLEGFRSNLLKNPEVSFMEILSLSLSGCGVIVRVVNVLLLIKVLLENPSSSLSLVDLKLKKVKNWRMTSSARSRRSREAVRAVLLQPPEITILICRHSFLWKLNAAETWRDARRRLWGRRANRKMPERVQVVSDWTRRGDVSVIAASIWSEPQSCSKQAETLQITLNTCCFVEPFCMEITSLMFLSAASNPRLDYSCEFSGVSHWGASWQHWKLLTEKLWLIYYYQQLQWISNTRMCVWLLEVELTIKNGAN